MTDRRSVAVIDGLLKIMPKMLNRSDKKCVDPFTTTMAAPLTLQTMVLIAYTFIIFHWSVLKLGLIVHILSTQAAGHIVHSILSHDKRQQQEKYGNIVIQTNCQTCQFRINLGNRQIRRGDIF
ncbi:hypothetical protein BDF20DRAFT_830880 [Mycotypha africana]|uniref:uncharacterized protein n=1 Tax=Mycotypha africana TaxID=64632 RepID=UPI002300FD9F|nr:uncharacterized protein BDF20DRAFT_830880 [Mycotypha africana]KAI8990778.1 hypothetical protein BDF20DRAFT_830880 [Mycotypha africana]